jgi:hypothetical protein
MTIEDVHKWINFIADKSIDNYFTSDEIDRSLDRAQIAYFNSEYSYYALAEKLQDSLSPFKVTYNFLTSDTPSGVITLTSDYMYMTGGYVTVVINGNTRNKSLKILSEDEVAYRLESKLRPVSTSKPFATIYGKVSGITLIQLYPKTSMAGTIFYLRRPAVPKFAYTQVGRVITYDPTNSVQLEWGESEIGEIMIRALEYLGVNAQDQTVAQFADLKSKEVN